MRKRQSTDAKMEKLQILELSDNAFKAAIIKMLKQALIDSPETNETIETISKEIEVIKNNQNRYFITGKCNKRSENLTGQAQ